MDTKQDISGFVRNALKGDREAFGEIISRYQGAVCAMAYAATGDIKASEDLAQETFIRAWRKLGGLREPGKFGGWIGTIARNTIINYQRSLSRRREDSTQPVSLETFASPDPSPRDRAISLEQQELLWRTLSELPDDYREPMVMFYRQGKSCAAVAEVLAIPENRVRQRLHAGRQMLRERMAAFVEEALEQTTPGKAFTIAVLAALPATAPQAAAAVIAGTAAKGSVAAHVAGGMALIGSILGPVLGIIGAVIGIRTSLSAARSPRERRYMRRSVVSIGVVAPVSFILGVLGTRAFLSEYRSSPNPTVLLLILAGAAIVFLLTLILLTVRFNRRIRRIREEEGTLEELAESGVHRSENRHTPGALSGAVGGGLVGSVAWTIPSSMSYGPWWMSLFFMGVTVACVVRFSLEMIRSPERFFAIARAAVLCSCGINMIGIAHFWAPAGGDAYMTVLAPMLIILGTGALLVALLHRREHRIRHASK